MRFSPKGDRGNSLILCSLIFDINNFIRIDFLSRMSFWNETLHLQTLREKLPANLSSQNHLVLTNHLTPLPSQLPPSTVYACLSSPHSCTPRPTASPPCASGASYRGRPCPRGWWACSRVCCATAPQVLAEGAPRLAAGW